MTAFSEMTRRERMLAAMRRQPVDRVPTDIWATGEVHRQLVAALGPAYHDRLHIDRLPGVGPAYVGPPLPEAPPGESVDFWGIRRRHTDYDGGAYMEQVHCPLAHVTSIDQLDDYAWPSTDWFDYAAARERAAELHRDFAVQGGYMATFYFHNQLRGLEQSLIDPLDDPELTRAIVDRIGGFFVDHHRRLFEAAGEFIDVAQVTDDLGTQTGPMISLEVFREFYRPWMQRCIDLCREFGVLVMHHDDGAIRAFLPELVEMGVDILNPIQWRCPGMAMAELKRDFGDSLCFHGAVDNQETLPRGAPDDVRAEVRRCIDQLASDGTGYVLAPCHNLQPVTPLANIEAMYDEAHHYGRMG